MGKWPLHYLLATVGMLSEKVLLYVLTKTTEQRCATKGKYECPQSFPS